MEKGEPATAREAAAETSSSCLAADSMVEGSEEPAMPPGRLSARNTSSKYDFVKVKVWLGDNADHYYVLSRFLLSRMLTVTKVIPNHVAIKIALELKKLLVDNSLLDVSQSDLEANLFKLMERRGYGEEYINRYKMMTRFHHQRVPLVILVCGTACAGKSTIATQLAQRLNLPNVLHTDMVYELLRTSTDAPLASTPVWARDFKSQEELVTEFCRECRVVRKGDLKKAMKDGKPIIIEGIHLDPSIYLMDEENGVLTGSFKKAKVPASAIGTSVDKLANSVETVSLGSSTDNVSGSVNSHEIERDSCSQDSLIQGQCISGSHTPEVTEVSAPSDVTDTVPESQGGGKKVESTLKQDKPVAESIIVPIVLKMADFDHKDQDTLVRNLKIIQDYLCSFETQGLTVVNVSATTFPQTLDWLHGYLLQCIERGISHGPSSSN
ncbi:2-phosphoglycerate kinase [Nymphaea thermarum]|nr:2-phosphoglycerate kinase [Nymphaea thermarum]